MSVRYHAEDTGAVFGLLSVFSPSVVEVSDEAAASATFEMSFDAPPDEAERLAVALREATQGRVAGLWRESADADFPFPVFVAGTR